LGWAAHQVQGLAWICCEFGCAPSALTTYSARAFRDVGAKSLWRSLGKKAAEVRAKITELIPAVVTYLAGAAGNAP
jgi:hypothetical protein